MRAANFVRFCLNHFLSCCLLFRYTIKALKVFRGFFFLLVTKLSSGARCPVVDLNHRLQPCLLSEGDKISVEAVDAQSHLNLH